MFVSAGSTFSSINFVFNSNSGVCVIDAGGDVSFGQGFLDDGEAMAIVTSGNITTGGANSFGFGEASNEAVQTNGDSATNGGSVLLIAGAASHVNGSDIVVDGPSATGGYIDLSGFSGGIQTNGTQNGGDVALVAFGVPTNSGGEAGSGVVNLGSSSITTYGTTLGVGQQGTNGSVTIIAGAPTGTAITVGSINAYGGNNTTGGSVYLANGNLANTPFTVIHGGFLEINFTADFPPTPGGAINVGTIGAGGYVTVNAGTNVTLGTIQHAGIQTSGLGGGVTIVAGGNNGGSIMTGAILDAWGTVELEAYNNISVSGNIQVQTSDYIKLLNTNYNNNIGGNIEVDGSMTTYRGRCRY